MNKFTWFLPKAFVALALLGALTVGAFQSKPAHAYVECSITHWATVQSKAINYYIGVSHYTGTLYLYGLYDSRITDDFCGGAYASEVVSAAYGSLTESVQVKMFTDSGTYNGNLTSVCGGCGNSTSSTATEYPNTASATAYINGTGIISTDTFGTSTHPWP